MSEAESKLTSSVDSKLLDEPEDLSTQTMIQNRYLILVINHFEMS